MSTPSAAAGRWDPRVYLAFAAFRARPVEDLLQRISLDFRGDIPGAIYDLGCGAGNITQMLAARWPDRDIIGLDSSPEMLAEAQKRSPVSRWPSLRWELGDIGAWSPASKAAMIFANAALHWVPDHAALFPRLARALVKDGVLAVQMPNTADAPYRTCLSTVLARAPWNQRLAAAAPHSDPLRARAYYDVLAPHAAAADIWETHYVHVLESLDAVVAWVSGAALVPYLSLLDDAEKQLFLADYRDAARDIYHPQKDGRILFTMRRLFVLARI